MGLGFRVNGIGLQTHHHSCARKWLLPASLHSSGFVGYARTWRSTPADLLPEPKALNCESEKF